MKDYLGKELAVGDTVVFPRPRYRDLVTGTIIKLTPQKVRAEYKCSYSDTCVDTYTEYPSQFIKIP